MPLASALVARRENYFDVLGSYRSGDLAPLVGTFVRSTRIAAAESRITAQRLHEIPSQWRELTGPVRRGSAAAKILALLLGAPILFSDDAVALIDAPRSSVFDAIGRLRDAGVLRVLTGRRRNQIWGAVLFSTSWRISGCGSLRRSVARLHRRDPSTWLASEPPACSSTSARRP